jgi:tRNA A-37 threonylcarbamoyl transferase component Bud32
VLRRTRDRRSVENEARVMCFAAEHGYPVPAIEEVRADGTEIVMERIDGPDDDGRHGETAVDDEALRVDAR